MIADVDLLDGVALVVPLAHLALAWFAGRDMKQQGAPMLAGISTCLLVLLLPVLGIPLWLIARHRLIRDASTAAAF